MKLLHTADLHVGDSRNLPNYLERQRRMLAWLGSQARQNDIDLLLIAGDVFDSKYLMARERDMFLEWLLQNDRDAVTHRYWTIMTSGNHDVIEDDYTHLRGLRMLAERNLLQRTLIIEHAQTLRIGDCEIVALPYANYHADELADAVRSLRADAVPNGSSARYCVVMAHEAIAGAVNESGTYRAKGPTIDDSLDVTYWALGDIHKPFQQMAPNAWYSGSPIQNDFGDVSRERGALLVDLDAPTQPQRLLIGDAVTPLITLADEPDEWPTDAIIRFEGTPDEIAARTFPANVVAFKPVVTPSRLSDTVETSGYAMLEGVEDVMVGLVPDTLQSDVIDCLKSAIETV